MRRFLSRYRLVTQHDMEKWGRKIMEAIENFSASVNQAFDKLGLAVEGVSGDVAALKAEIEKLQTTPGTLTAEDQALLDSIQTRANDVANKLAALDALTEQTPTPPA